MCLVNLVPWRFCSLLGFDTERVVGREVVASFFLFCLEACLVAARWVGGVGGRHSWCELCRSRRALWVRSQRPGLEVPDPVGADSAPLEVMQAGVMVQYWVMMAPLEVLQQGHALAVA